MSEPNTSQTVTISSEKMAVIAAVASVIAAAAFLVAALTASITIGLSIVTFDRVVRTSEGQESNRARIELLEAYEHDRRKQRE